MLLLQWFLPYLYSLITILCSRMSYTEAQKKSIPLRNSLDETSRLPMKGESSINYGNLDTSEPGFDYTPEEMEKLKIWPRGVIPYFIDDFSFDKVLRDRLRAFLEHANSVSGVQFSELSQPPEDDSRWVFFINRRGVLPCADLDFRQFNNTGVQKVVIGYDCMEPGNLAEIILALVGVPPQHNSPDREKYVQVQKDNILEGKAHLFEKFSDSEWLFHDVEYDFTSVGHYGYHKYTANGGATLKPVEMVDVRAGEATSFSFNDIRKIRMIYNFIIKKGRVEKQDTGSCSKLFKPGVKFDKFIPDEDEDDKIKARPKPSKYTGKSEEKSPAVNNDDQNQDDNDEDKGKEQSNEEQTQRTLKLRGSSSTKTPRNLLLSDINSDE